MLFANPIESLVACGLLMPDHRLDTRGITVGKRSEDFLNAVKTGRAVTVEEDGTGTIGE